MHMWMWFGYDLGEFLFPGLTVDSRWAFALTWIALFFVSLLFEASKVYLARVQREAQKKLLPYKSDERRNLLCEREQGSLMEPTTSRNAGGGAVSRWAAIRLKMSINCHQTAIFLLHNVVGYLLMLAVMLYNVELLLAVIFGMMLGYFLFGTKLTRLQMQCFSTKRAVICTPECDDTAETSTPPLDGSLSLESDFFICNTRTCIQPSHYLPARTADGAPSDLANATCCYGAKKCPSKVARLKKMQSTASTSQYSQECESPTVEDVQLLRTERQGCCKKKQEPPPDEGSSREDTSQGCCRKETEEPKDVSRDASPQITCCHASKTVSSDSQEQIVS